MGFDCYGINPIENSILDEDAVKWQDKDGFPQWSEMNESDTTKYFAAKEKYEDANPGVYFRNNVWWWRPLWQFVCYACDDFLSVKDMESGNYNDCRRISKTKAKRIAARIRKLDKSGIIDEQHEYHQEKLEKAEKHNKKVEQKRIALKKEVDEKVGPNIVPANYPKEYKERWDKIQGDENWSGHYPFDADNIRSFGEFCDNSGGFEIC